jgi:hypothetical protein
MNKEVSNLNLFDIRVEEETTDGWKTFIQLSDDSASIIHEISRVPDFCGLVEGEKFAFSFESCRLMLKMAIDIFNFSIIRGWKPFLSFLQP